MTEYHIFKRLPGFLYELNELVGVVYSAKNIFGVGLMLNVLILRLIRGLEMAFLSQKSCFCDFWTLCACLFVAIIVYSGSGPRPLAGRLGGSQTLRSPPSTCSKSTLQTLGYHSPGD